ncbi:1-deoxy-D-xylulose-5-phosphate reductoisomerase [Afifella sp. JA880]|uniref:1-deoxy-D-xylulose-5-phosphate reductoisomerase n=1 Tax=Afifella sp. JA880 TaxID=2975280 RepID=UPI0021BA8EF8|nr:1-deoxy-D-xylulose-5-phosphate reductoisomerase [Afifella sp. JA880]MCT8266010.1 1-deoxy-D-xylulose-5-phosphate reductoisomerase [Afifella sp. JA880]
MARIVTILGATGSIGKSTVDLMERDLAREGGPAFKVRAVTAGTKVDELADVARRVKAESAVIRDKSRYGRLKEALDGSGIRVSAGDDAVCEAAAEPADRVLSAIVGAAGVAPTAAAIRAGNDIALANKECLICAGSSFMALAREKGVRILPVDSEHNAIFQLLVDVDPASVDRLVLTASGGPFRAKTADELAKVTVDEALHHPTWSMGPKITVDSATLMNKGLELIEARHLFGFPPEQLGVLIHPQSKVHAFVVFRDGSWHGELGAPDMRRPIDYCLNWPDRAERATSHLDLAEVGMLSFEKPDSERFPALRIAREAMVAGRGAPTVLNAANEIAVAAFLDRRIGFVTIPQLVERVLEEADKAGLMHEPETVEAALVLDGQARDLAAGRLLAA